MTKEQFIQNIKSVVYDRSIEGTILLLCNPPGRHPVEALRALSLWFNQLPQSDRDRIEAIIRIAVRQALFGMLAVLDGERPISGAGERISVELHPTNGDSAIVLNDAGSQPLHDLFASVVPPP